MSSYKIAPIVTITPQQAMDKSSGARSNSGKRKIAPYLFDISICLSVNYD